VPPRGYWARREAGRSTIQVALTPRSPGASNRLGGWEHGNYYHGTDWPDKFLALAVPPEPAFDEDMSSVTERIRKMVGKIRYPRNFDMPHTMVAKLLAHEETKRADYLKYGSSYYKPRYDDGIEHRRMLVINAVFMALARLGCRPSMSISKYGQDSREDRELRAGIGKTYLEFSVEPVQSRKEGEKERLRLAFGSARNRANATSFWEDNDKGKLENQLTNVLVEMLVSAETVYRHSLVRHREWIIERKAAAEAELKRRKEEAKREARELREKQARERIGRLLAQAKALDRANQIRAYVEAAPSQTTNMTTPLDGIDQWAAWARQEADRIDPVKNGTIAGAIEELSRA
jgi:hypothetical protein